MKTWLLIGVSLIVVTVGVLWADRGEALDTSDGVEHYDLATFAGGCFWCMEKPFEALPGVATVVSGYSGGRAETATYKQVSSGRTQHREVIQVRYDPMIISYEELLDHFWRQIDPTDAGGSFVDRGHQYTSAIYFHDETQRDLAQQSLANLSARQLFDKPIATAIESFKQFYPAEEYHQDYYRRNPIRYHAYRAGSGRDPFIKRVWTNVKPIIRPSTVTYAKPSDATLRKTLTPLQYRVTQEDGTERPFNNTYWSHKAAGIYVDVVTGEPLFASVHKFDSGTGWPSFTQPIDDGVLVRKRDHKLLVARTEVRSRYGDSHLGHVFDDGPEPTGLRYCINSAALRFVPVAELEKNGLAKYATLFSN